MQIFDASPVIRYELYDGLPTIGKWIEATNGGAAELLLETMVVEELHASEHAKSRMHVETNFMPRKTDWQFAQIPAADPHGGSYNGACRVGDRLETEARPSRV